MITSLVPFSRAVARRDRGRSSVLILISGCLRRNSRRAARKLPADSEVQKPIHSFPRSAAVELLGEPSASICSSTTCASRMILLPAADGVIPFRDRLKIITDVSCSSSRIDRLSVDCLTFKISAAFRKLPYSAAVTV